MPEGPLRARLGTGRARYMVLVVERIELDVDVCRSVGNCLQLSSCRRRVHPELSGREKFGQTSLLKTLPSTIMCLLYCPDCWSLSF